MIAQSQVMLVQCAFIYNPCGLIDTIFFISIFRPVIWRLCIHAFENGNLKMENFTRLCLSGEVTIIIICASESQQLMLEDN